jgi:hypothetical protein
MADVNVSPGVGVLTFTGLVPAVSRAPQNLAAVKATGPHVDLTWTDHASGNTDYSIERRNATDDGAFAQIALTGSGTAESYHDVGAFVAKHRYAYRVVVVGGPSAGEASNEVAIFGAPSLAGRRRRMGY